MRPFMPFLGRLLTEENIQFCEQAKWRCFNLYFKGFSEQIADRMLHFAVFLLFAFCYKSKRYRNWAIPKNQEANRASLIRVNGYVLMPLEQRNVTKKKTTISGKLVSLKLFKTAWWLSYFVQCDVSLPCRSMPDEQMLFSGWTELPNQNKFTAFPSFARTRMWYHGANLCPCDWFSER